MFGSSRVSALRVKGSVIKPNMRQISVYLLILACTCSIPICFDELVKTLSSSPSSWVSPSSSSLVALCSARRNPGIGGGSRNTTGAGEECEGRNEVWCERKPVESGLASRAVAIAASDRRTDFRRGPSVKSGALGRSLRFVGW